MNMRNQAQLRKDNEPVTLPKEITLREITDVLSLTIKHDDDNKLIVFLCMLSAYTDKSQMNVSLNAPSATGKTYLATEIARLFPDEDKVVRSGASPTSFFYGPGELDKERGAKIVSLERKILLFYEQPNPALQEKLRALLSHDEREITHVLTNKSRGRNQADKIILRGYAATVFCSAGMRLDEQETTRAILISPETTEAKIKQAIHLRARRSADEAKFTDWLESHPERARLKKRIIAIRNEKVDEVTITDADIAAIEKRFLAMIHTVKPRNQRDIDHLLQLIKTIALLNVWRRRQSDGKIVANQMDIDQAFSLWEAFFESQNLNLPPAVLSFYKKYIVPAYLSKYKSAGSTIQLAMDDNKIGLTSQELGAYFIQEEETTLNNDLLRKQILPQLQAAGLISVEKPKTNDNDIDKRTRHIFPKVLTDDDKKNIGTRGADENGWSDYDQLIAML